MTRSKWNKEERSYNYEEDYSDTDDQSFYDEESDISDSSDFEDTSDQSYDEMSDSCDDDKMKSYEECPYCDDY